jgi:hypothetical protein
MKPEVFFSDSNESLRRKVDVLATCRRLAISISLWKTTVIKIDEV